MIDKEKLFWGNPCKKGHKKADNTNLRCITYKNGCVMCMNKRRFADMDQDEMYRILTTPHVPKRTEEEKAAGRVAASMRWNAKNKDKTRQYMKKYQEGSKEEIAARKKERFAALPEEEKEKIRSRQRANSRRQRLRKIAAMTPEELAARKPRGRKRILTADEAREKRKNDARARYQAMTPEQKSAYLEKQRTWRDIRNQKDKE